MGLCAGLLRMPKASEIILSVLCKYAVRAALAPILSYHPILDGTHSLTHLLSSPAGARMAERRYGRSELEPEQLRVFFLCDRRSAPRFEELLTISGRQCMTTALALPCTGSSFDSMPLRWRHVQATVRLLQVLHVLADVVRELL